MNGNIDFRNFTEKLIDKYFENNNIDDEDFLIDLEQNIQSSQTIVSSILDRLLKENEYNNKIANETKEEYFEKLDQITSLFARFELSVDGLNKHYADKLAYISVLSKQLGNYEKFNKNINFANKIFDYVVLLNSSEDINVILPEIFKHNDKILEEGVEVFEAFRQIVDIASRDFPIFAKNFKVIESKMKTCIQESIKDFYENNQLNQLEKLMKVTEIFHSDFIIEMYITYIIETMNLNFIIKSLKNISYEGMSNEMFVQIFTIIDEFYDNIIRGVILQYGHEASKIYLIFPEAKQKIIISALVSTICKKIEEFRRILVSEKDKNDETYVKIIEYIYPKSLSFVNTFKDTLNYSKTDLWNNMQQDTNHFLREIEAIYMYKERSLLQTFLSHNYESKIKNANTIKRQYELKQSNIEQFQNDLFDLIHSTNFSIISKFCVDTILRYEHLIGNKEEQIDLTHTLTINILDCVKLLLETYCNLIKLLYVEREKNNCMLSEPQFYILGKLNFLIDDFQHIFIFDLKEIFKGIKFFDVVEEETKRRINFLKSLTDQVYLQLSTYSSGSLNQAMKTVKYKETYNCSGKYIEGMLSDEIEKVVNFLKPILITVYLFKFRFQRIGLIIIGRRYIHYLLKC
jgi:DNA-binding phage protein